VTVLDLVYSGGMFRLLSVLLLTASLCAQTPPSAPDARELTARFGSAFTVDSAFPVLTADLDGDGEEDAVVVATCKEPLLDQAEYQYKVIDPYNAFFGFGDPRVTAQYSAQEIHPRLLLVLHNWRSPKQKFAIINISFEKLSLSRVLVKKKARPVPVIRAEDITGGKQSLYWGGKAWKWRDESME
jgi:hypothetical protein